MGEILCKLLCIAPARVTLGQTWDGKRQVTPEDVERDEIAARERLERGRQQMLAGSGRPHSVDAEQMLPD